MKTELSTRMAARRKELGLTQQQLANHIKKSYVTVYRWEQGEVEPKGKNLFALASALKCSPAWLLFGDEQTSPTPADELPATLSDREKRLLELFNFLPESEKEIQINELEARVENFNKLFDELLKVRKSTAKKN